MNAPTSFPAQFFPPAAQQPSYYYPLGPPPSQFQPPSCQPPYFSNPPLPPPAYQHHYGGYPVPPPPPNHFQPRYPAGPRPYFRGRGRGRGRGVAKNYSGGRVGGHFECKACSKEYKSQETYNTHLESHQKCSKCDFSAVPRALKEHELIHILPDCLKFYTPEEIQKWREDRKKNFPTAENVARKAKLAAEKTARGDTALTPLHRYIRQLVGDDGEDRKGGRGRWRGRGRSRGRGNFRGRGGRWQNSRERMVEESSDVINEHGESTGSVGHESRNDLQSSIEEHVTTTTTTTSHVTSDMATSADHTGGGKDEGKDEALEDGECVPEEGILDAILADAAGRQSHRHRVVGAEGTDTPATGEGKVGSHRAVADSAEGDGVRTRKRRQKWVSRQENKRRKFAAPKLEDIPIRKATLLEKLLAAEVRKEQNILLQCMRYIVDTGFLGHRKPPGEHKIENRGEEEKGGANGEGERTEETDTEEKRNGGEEMEMEDEVERGNTGEGMEERGIEGKRNAEGEGLEGRNIEKEENGIDGKRNGIQAEGEGLEGRGIEKA